MECCKKSCYADALLGVWQCIYMVVECYEKAMQCCFFVSE